MRSIREIKIPATAKPRGLLNIPKNERRKPINQTTQFTPGIQENIREIRDIINPAAPTPFDSLTGRSITICCCGAEVGSILGDDIGVGERGTGDIGRDDIGIIGWPHFIQAGA